MYSKDSLFLAVLAAVLISPSCNKLDSETDELKSVLDDHYRNDIVGSCTFTIMTYPTLFAKQEFREFHNKELCEGKVVIDTVRHLEPDKLEVEIRLVFQTNPRILESLLKAWSALEKRYRTLKPELVPHGGGMSAYVYVDSTDGEVFVSGKDNPGNIFESVQWQHMQKLKAFFASKLNEREWQTDVFTVTLVRESGQWKIAKK